MRGNILKEYNSECTPDNSSGNIDADEVGSNKSVIGEGTDEVDLSYLTGLPLLFSVASLLFAIFLSAIDQTIVTTAISSIEESFNSFSNIGWVVSGYMLPLAILALAWGRISLMFGRKTSILISVGIFELGSLVSALSKNMGMLIGGRVITGIGGSGIQTNAYLIISEITPISQRGIVLGFLTMSLIPAAVLGPVLGGLFSSSNGLTWRWCFYVNLPFGGVSFLFLSVFYKPRKIITNLNRDMRSKIRSLDLAALCILTVSLTLLLVGISLGGAEYQTSWKSPITICFIVFGGVLFIFAVIFEFYIFKADNSLKIYPIIPRFLILKRQVLAPSLTIMISSITYYGCSAYVSIYFENLLGMSPKLTGFHLLPLILPTLLSTILCGLACSKLGIVKPVVLVGAALSVVGCGLLTLLKYDSNPSRKIGCQFLLGFAFGFFNQACLISAQLSVKENEKDYILIITAFMAFSRSLGASLGGIVMTAIYSSITTNFVKRYNHLYGISVLELLKRRSENKLNATDTKILIDALGKGIKWVFYSALILSVLCLISACFITNDRVPLKKAKLDKDAGKGKKSNTDDC